MTDNDWQILRDMDTKFDKVYKELKEYIMMNQQDHTNIRELINNNFMNVNDKLNSNMNTLNSQINMQAERIAKLESSYNLFRWFVAISISGISAFIGFLIFVKGL